MYDIQETQNMLGTENIQNTENIQDAQSVQDNSLQNNTLQDTQNVQDNILQDNSLQDTQNVQDNTLQDNILQDNTLQDNIENIEVHRKNVTVEGLSGLSNIGNTCYMNAVIQCLSATELLITYFLRNHFHDHLYVNMFELAEIRKRKIKKMAIDEKVIITKQDMDNRYEKSLSHCFYLLISKIWGENQNVHPTKFKKVIGYHNDNFKGYDQCDSPDLLGTIFEVMDKELKSYDPFEVPIPEYLIDYEENIEKYKKQLLEEYDKCTIAKNYVNYIYENKDKSAILKYIKYEKYLSKNGTSIIDKIFTNVFCTEFTCKNCGYLSQTIESFNMLPLSICNSQDSISLKSCLDNDFNEKEVKEYTCSLCREKSGANQKTFLWTTNNVIIIHLKRFENNLRKISTLVDYPLEFSFDDYYYNKSMNTTSYQLYGVINHSGILNGGHYTAFTKNPVNDKWYEFNDAHIVHVPDEEIEKTVISEKGYILFYKAK